MQHCVIHDTAAAEAVELIKTVSSDDQCCWLACYVVLQYRTQTPSFQY